MDLPTLDEFFTWTYPYNSYIAHPLFSSLYVRKGRCAIATASSPDRLPTDFTLQIASITAHHTRAGSFSSLLADLSRKHPSYYLYIESVFTPYFARALLKRGFEQTLASLDAFAPSFVKPLQS